MVWAMKALHRPLLLLTLVVGLVGVLGYGAAWQRQRVGLRLQNHLRGQIKLALTPLGRPLAAEGRVFVVSGRGADTQLLGVSRRGQPLWNQRLGESVTAQPLLVPAGGGLRVLAVAQGGILPFTLGGDALPRIAIDSQVGDVVAADEDGDLYLLGRGGRLARLAPQGDERARLSVGLTEARHLLLLPGDRLLLAGARPGATTGEAWLGLRTAGQVVLTQRVALPAPPSGMVSMAGDQVAIAAGREVLILRGGAVARRLPLPGLAQGAPVAGAAGSLFVLLQGEDEGRLVHLGPDGALRGRTDAAAGCGLLAGRAGQVLACFQGAPGLWARLLPQRQGILVLGAEGQVSYRQELPAPPQGLALGEDGALLVALRDERSLFVLDRE